MNLSDSIIERLCYYAKMQPQHDAAVSANFTLSYSELTDLIEAQAIRLIDQGLTKQDTIGIYCSDEIQHLILNLAAIYIGATSCTLPSFDTKEVRQSIAESCGVSFFADSQMAIDLTKQSSIGSSSSSRLAHAENAKLLFSTSGTTGRPKQVVHYDSDLAAQAHRHIQSAKERFACVASIEHNFAKRHRLYC